MIVIRLPLVASRSLCSPLLKVSVEGPDFVTSEAPASLGEAAEYVVESVGPDASPTTPNVQTFPSPVMYLKRPSLPVKSRSSYVERQLDPKSPTRTAPAAEGHVLFHVLVKANPPPSPGMLTSLCSIYVLPVARQTGFSPSGSVAAFLVEQLARAGSTLHLGPGAQHG